MGVGGGVLTCVRGCVGAHRGRAMRVMGAAALGLAQKSEAAKFVDRNTLRQKLAVACACCQPDSAVLGE